MISRVQVPAADLEIDGRNYTVRLMTAADYPAVRNLLPGVTTCVMHLSAERVADLLELPTYYPFLLEDAESRALVAFAELILLPHLGRTFDARLERVIVDPAYRERKVGSRLCEHLLRVAEERLLCNRCDLTVEKENARHIYKNKLGFREVTTTVMRVALPRPAAEAASSEAPTQAP